jgi:hypothetical protein
MGHNTQQPERLLAACWTVLFTILWQDNETWKFLLHSQIFPLSKQWSQLLTIMIELYKTHFSFAEWHSNTVPFLNNLLKTKLQHLSCGG